MEKRLTRNEQEKTVAGVCAGLAEYFEVDVTWVRIAFVLAVLAGFSGVLAYIVLWVVVPVKPYTPNYSQFNADYRVYEQAKPAEPTAQASFTEVPYPKKKSGSAGIFVGIAFVVFGAFFLLDEFHFVPYWFEFHKLWPLVFIIPGVMMLSRSDKKSWKDEWREQQATTAGSPANENPAPEAATEDKTTSTN